MRLRSSRELGSRRRFTPLLAVVTPSGRSYCKPKSRLTLEASGYAKSWLEERHLLTTGQKFDT